MDRTRTSPPGNASSVHRLVFGFASWQQYEHGYDSAYRHLVAEPLDLLIHLGDCIYEHGRDVYPAPTRNVRHHVGGEADSLTDYRPAIRAVPDRPRPAGGSRAFRGL